MLPLQIPLYLRTQSRFIHDTRAEMASCEGHTSGEPANDRIP